MAALASRHAETTSVRSSVTEEDLEEARQRLLDHMEEGSEEDTRYIVEPESNHLGDRQPPYGNGLPPHGNRHLPHHHHHHQQQQGTLPPVTNTAHPQQDLWPRYGSVTPSVTSQPRQRKPVVRRKRYRLPFLILLAFDWGLVMFFSVVVMKDLNLKHYFDLSISNKYFDLVIIGTFRVILNLLFYLVLGWVTRIVMALTTIVSAIYLPIKAYYSWSDVKAQAIIQSIAILMMLLVTFGMPWITAFFFEFKYLPAEQARLEIPSWWNWKAWLWPQSYVKRETEDTPSLQDVAERRSQMPDRIPRPRLSASTVSLDFRTPVGSSRASPIPYYDHDHRHGDDDLPPIRENDEYNLSLEHHSPECDQTLSAEDLRFKHEALSVLEAYKTITSSNDGWTAERSDRELKIYSRVMERRKVFKAEGIIHTSAKKLFDVLYPGNLTPEWNSQCGLNETVYRVDDVTDIIYSISNAVGPVSSRDFVSVRQVEKSGGMYYAASKSIVTVMKPEQAGKVRAENGPCGYLVIPVSASECKMIWVVNTNLKGWLLQSVIDQTLNTVITSTMEKLGAYIATRCPPAS